MTMADVTNEMRNGAPETQTTEKPQANSDSVGVSTSTASLNDSFTVDSDALDVNEIFNSNQRRRSIQFGQVLIRTHGQALGDNPSCSRGPALTLDWPYNEDDPISIDDYEEWAKDNRRSKTEILVPYTARREILFTYGYSPSDINAGIKSVNKAKKQRRASLDTSPSLMGTLKTKLARRKSA